MADGKSYFQRRTLVGTVLKKKMEKTAVVAVERRVEHPLYRKQIRRTTKLKVHDPKNETQEGDTVLIALSRPISRHKHWRLLKILHRQEKVGEVAR